MAKVETEARGAVTLVTVNRPEVHNCFDGETADQMTGAVEAFGADEEQQVMVVTGAGGRAFCSGADLKAPGSLVTRPDGRTAMPFASGTWPSAWTIIAAMSGAAAIGTYITSSVTSLSPDSSRLRQRTFARLPLPGSVNVR